jgi:hypothetical protein
MTPFIFPCCPRTEVAPQRDSAGCRGVNGPFPQPLLMKRYRPNRSPRLKHKRAPASARRARCCARRLAEDDDIAGLEPHAIVLLHHSCYVRCITLDLLERPGIGTGSGLRLSKASAPRPASGPLGDAAPVAPDGMCRHFVGPEARMRARETHRAGIALPHLTSPVAMSSTRPGLGAKIAAEHSVQPSSAGNVFQPDASLVTVPRG